MRLYLVQCYSGGPRPKGAMRPICLAVGLKLRWLSIGPFNTNLLDWIQPASLLQQQYVDKNILISTLQISFLSPPRAPWSCGPWRRGLTFLHYGPPPQCQLYCVLFSSRVRTELVSGSARTFVLLSIVALPVTEACAVRARELNPWPDDYKFSALTRTSNYSRTNSWIKLNLSLATRNIKEKHRSSTTKWGVGRGVHLPIAMMQPAPFSFPFCPSSPL